MFVRLSTYDIPGDRIGEASGSFADALEKIAACRGFREGYFLVSRESERGVAVTFWDDHDAVTASRVTASRLRSAAATEVDGEVVSADEFEVAVHLRAVPEGKGGPAGLAVVPEDTV